MGTCLPGLWDSNQLNIVVVVVSVVAALPRQTVMIMQKVLVYLICGFPGAAEAAFSLVLLLWKLWPLLNDNKIVVVVFVFFVVTSGKDEDALVVRLFTQSAVSLTLQPSPFAWESSARRRAVPVLQQRRGSRVLQEGKRGSPTTEVGESCKRGRGGISLAWSVNFNWEDLTWVLLLLEVWKGNIGVSGFQRRTQVRTETCLSLDCSLSWTSCVHWFEWQWYF